MKTLSSAIIIFSLCLLSAYAQFDFKPGTGLAGGIPGGTAPRTSAPKIAGEQAAGAAAIKEWTVMVYVNGKNNVEDFGLYNVNRMELAGSNGAMNVVAELGRMNGQSADVHMDGDWTGSRRYYITQDNDQESIKSGVIQSFQKADMGDWKHLVDFARWAKAAYPARRYALIIWNHGSGWLTDKTAIQNKGISYDDETRNHISTPELGAAMREIGKVDILAFDACLMQMAEVAYEVKDYADYVVASEEVEPVPGYPYETMLSVFTGSRSSGEAASAMVTAFEKYSVPRKKKVTLSAVSFAAMGEFMGAFNAWTEALLASDKKAEIKNKFYAAASYHYLDNKDLYDFARQAAEIDPRIAEQSRALMDVIAGKLVVNNIAYKKGAGRNTTAHGLAIYLPTVIYNDRYDDLAFARDTRWDEFLKEMIAVKGNNIGGCGPRPGPGDSIKAKQDYMACIEKYLSQRE